METQLFDAVADYDNSIKKSSLLLKSGGIVAIPTETVYGLAADCFNEEAVKKIFIAKGRPQDNPLIVHIASLDQLDIVAKDIPPITYTLAKKFWPGPFTMILKRNRLLPSLISAGLNTVAVRMPSHPTARDVISASCPLAAPSANSSGKPSPTEYTHVLEDLSGKIDAVIKDKPCAFGVESTVITLIGEHPCLLRPGAVTYEELLEYLPDLQLSNAILSPLKQGDATPSPGMKYKHYAPNCEAYLVEADLTKYSEFINKNNHFAICFYEDEPYISGSHIPYGSITDDLTLAQNVFKVLRRLNSESVDKVYIHAPGKQGVGLAVYNRLIRACGFRVIRL